CRFRCECPQNERLRQRSGKPRYDKRQAFSQEAAMMIFKKAIPRRAFLRGLGATIALPLLDAMVPAFAASTGSAVKTPMRLGIVYAPNGMWPMDKWTPKTEGAGFEMTPTVESLTPFKDQLIVLSGLAHSQALALPGEGGGDHERACATYL